MFGHRRRRGLLLLMGLAWVALVLSGCGLGSPPTSLFSPSDTLSAQRRSTTFAPSWAKDAVFYQIFPERFRNGDRQNDPPGALPWGGQPQNFNFFGGDLQGVIEKLDYLKDLGVNALYFNPIFASPSNHKYDTADYLKVDPHFGDLAVFRRLVREAHARGLRIIIDGVFNHTGDQHTFFRDAEARGPSSPYWNYYHFYGFPVVKTPKPNYESWWGFASLPRLMVEKNPQVAEYLLNKVIDSWDKEGIDGWRLDVPNEVGFDFWLRFRQKVRSDNPESYIVGEIWEDAAPWLQGDRFDSVMNYIWRKNVVDFFAAETTRVDDFDAYQEALRNRYPAPATEVMFNLLGSHDVERFLTLAGGDGWRLKAAVFYQMTYPGTPVIYYGDEVGMTGGKDPDNRRCFSWDQKDWDRELRDHYRKLIRIRKEHPALRAGEFRTLLRSNDKRLYAYARRTADEELVVLINGSTYRQDVSLDLTATRDLKTSSRLLDLYSGRSLAVSQGRVTVTGLDGHMGVILAAGSAR